MVRLVFMADMQLGMYATFSGFDDAEVAEYAQRDLRVWSVPKTEGFEWDAHQYELAVALVNTERPDLVIIGGDMIDDPNAEDQYDEFMRITRLIDSDIDVHWLPGNHDVGADTVVPTPQSLATYRAAFGPDYFAFDHHGVRFVGLNTTVLDHPEQVPGEVDAQIGFLEQELTDAARRQMPAILVGHHPLFLASVDEEDNYWNLPSERRHRIVDLIHRHGVRLMLAGHWHRNNIATDGAFEMVTSGPVGYPLGADPSGLRVVDIQGHTIVHRYLALVDQALADQ